MPKRTVSQSSDVYAAIATAHLSGRSEALVEQTPLPVPARVLPLDPSGRAAFKPERKRDTETELRTDLARLRKHMTQFLADRAPATETKRITTPLKTFAWRVETPADRANFASTLSGEGEWQKVSIPHYGPPLGRAVTYYRTTFRVTKAMLKPGALFAHFNGVDYKAHVFVNGAYVGSHEGFFAPFEFDITAYVTQGANTLLVKVENDAINMGQPDGLTEIEGDKIYAASGLGYDDPEFGWHHCPPGMGIYQDVTIEARARVFISDIFVRPLNLTGDAEAWIEVHNCDTHAHAIHFNLSVYGQNFRRTIFANTRHTPVTIEIQGHGDVEKNLKKHTPQLAGPGVNYYRIPIHIPDPRLWDTETPWLYQLQAQLLADDGAVLDAQRQQFGLRAFTQPEDAEPKGRFFLNGREIRLRGANSMGWEQQSIMRGNWDQLIDDILLAKVCHMNFFRITQRPAQKAFYDYCDRLGMMAQSDLPLFGCLRRNQLVEAVRQALEMERLVRANASSILVSYINEPFPNGMSKPHRHMTRPELEDFFDMASRAIRSANPERVIKCVDGDYDPPASAGMPDNHCYSGWYIGHAIDLGKLNKGYWLAVKPGWKYGCGEFGAEGLEAAETMRHHYPREWLPANEDPATPWSPDGIAMAQTGRFHYLWFETQQTMPGWIEASQQHQAWVVRLMTEAFRRDSRMNTFAWHLFIDAWPAGWMKTLVDVDRRPKQAFFAYRDALSPLLVSLRTDRWRYWSGETVEMEAWVCNDTHWAPPGATLRYQLEIDGKTVASGMDVAEAPDCSSASLGLVRFALPETDKRRNGTVRAVLLDEVGHVLHETSQAIDIFPRHSVTEKPVALIDAPHGAGRGATLLAQLGIAPTSLEELPLDGVLLIDDPAAYEHYRVSIDTLVQAGATAVLLEWPAGSYHVGGDAITLQPGGMGSPHFVSRGTGHPLVDDFAVNDFKFWHDEAAGYVTPLLDTVVDPPVDGWGTLLNSGNGTWLAGWRAVPAAMEKPAGAGVYRVCQVKLANRVMSNPPAAIFAGRLLFSR